MKFIGVSILAAVWLCLLGHAIACQGQGATVPPIGHWIAQLGNGGDVSRPPVAKLSVRPDGQMVATVGCNRIYGRFVTVGEEIKLGFLPSTVKACLPHIYDAERKLIRELLAARTFRRDESTLRLLDESGLVTIEFKTIGL